MISEEEIGLKKIADTDYVIFPLLKHRYSPRIFKDDKIRKKHLRQLFEAARWSASSANQQPWRFIYAEKGSDAHHRMVDCLSDFNKKWAPMAPLLLFSAYKEKMDTGKENFHALHDLGLSLGSMTVQAQHLGIALHHMAGVDWKRAQKDFMVPEGYHITTAIALGYYGGPLENLPDDLQKKEVADRKRYPQEKFAFEGCWK